jgi:hypothetical protein
VRFFAEVQTVGGSVIDLLRAYRVGQGNQRGSVLCGIILKKLANGISNTIFCFDFCRDCDCTLLRVWHELVLTTFLIITMSQ